MRRRTIFAQPGNVQVMDRPAAALVMPGHWKQREKLARELGADVTCDADAKAFLKERGYEHVR